MMHRSYSLAAKAMTVPEGIVRDLSKLSSSKYIWKERNAVAINEIEARNYFVDGFDIIITAIRDSSYRHLRCRTLNKKDAYRRCCDTWAQYIKEIKEDYYDPFKVFFWLVLK